MKPRQCAEWLLQILHCDLARPAPVALAALTLDDWETFTEDALGLRISRHSGSADEGPLAGRNGVPGFESASDRRY